MIDLFMDYETTGFFINGRPYNYEEHCDAVQQALQLYHNEKLVAEDQMIVRNECRHINPKAQEIHSISQELIDAVGFNPRLAAELYLHYMQAADRIIIYNAQFDWDVLGVQLVRYSKVQMEDLSHPPVYCAMKMATDLVQIPAARGGFKWPKLQELHMFLFGEMFESAHDAMQDVRMMAKCFYEMEKRGVVTYLHRQGTK